MTAAARSDAAPLLLGIDIGSSRTKAMLLDGEGRQVATSVRPTPFCRVGGGTEATVASLLEAVAAAVEGLGDGRRRVGGIGIAGLAESGAPLDGHGTPLAPVMAWHDRRGEDVAARLNEQLGDDLAVRVGQPVRYVSSVAKLGWLVDHGLTGVRRWLGVPELCLRALSGAEATELSLAGRTGCRDVGRGTWMDEVARVAGFGVAVFPEVAAAGTTMGRVSAEGAGRFGLPAGVPVTVAGHDHLVGMLGCGAAADDVANSVGTAETVVARCPSLPDMAAVLDRGVAVSVFPGGREWALLASAARSGQVIEAVAATLGHPAAELDALALGADELDAPGLADSLRRREAPRLPPGPPGAVWQTLLHQLAALTVNAVVQVVALGGPRRRLVVFGGGAASLPWLGAKAELAPLPVWQMTTGEAVARGAALCAGVATGWWPSPDAAPAPELRPAPLTPPRPSPARG